MSNIAVELAYDDVVTMGLTNAQGQITFGCPPGQHKVRAWKGDELIGSWADISVKDGYKISVTLDVDKDPVVTGEVQIPPKFYKPIPPASEVSSAVSRGSDGGN